jgi:hypothetical protein
VYAPIVAQGSAFLLEHHGPAAFRAGYILVYVLALSLCGYEALLWPLDQLTLRSRAMFMAFVTGTLVTAGNIGLICHAAIIGSLLGFPRRRAPFVAAVCLAVLIKPTFATYLVVLLLEPVTQRTKVARMSAGLGAVAVVATLLSMVGRSTFPEWGRALRRVALSQQPGRGFLGWAAQLGLDGTSAAGAAIFVVLAFFLVLAGWSTVRRAAFGPRETLAFAIGLAQLLNPRLMTYDALALVPLGALICLAASRVSPAFGGQVRGVLALACALAVVLGCVGWMPEGQRIAAFALTMASLAVGFRSWRAR